MIATHNIKVNGVWYHAGDKLPGDEPKQERMELPETAPEATAEEAPEAAEPAAAEPVKPKSTRRKKISE